MKTTEFLTNYLSCIGINPADYEMKVTVDEGTKDVESACLIALSIKGSNPRIGILRGKEGRHLHHLKQLLTVIGRAENIMPFLIVKIINV